MSWLILGAGRSGMGAKKLLESSGQSAFLYDENTKYGSMPNLIFHPDHPIFNEKDLTFVVSPGFPPQHTILKRAKDLGLKVITEIDLALEHFRGTLIAVTGTNGKSTTVMMISHLLKSKTIDHSVGGNIGIAASSLMIEKPSLLVLELSSYQLESSHKIAPHVAVITGIAPDHQSRHGTMEAYLASKWRIFEKQSSSDFAIIEKNAYNMALSMNLKKPEANVILLDKHHVNFPRIRNFSWKHDCLNALFSAHAVSKLLKIDAESLLVSFENFVGLPHRCQIIGRRNGYRIINDSKSTTMDSTIHALSDLNGQVTLFLGGLSKGEEFKQIAEFRHTIASIVAFGPTSAQIARDLASYVPVFCFTNLKAATEALPNIMETLRGDLLFSPACPSQDEFSDFEERGTFFTNACSPFLENLGCL
ncbi:MAG: UDP-N-acetylmuramoyl-L-alanine--D-glutamate ligase [Deltaproteobacteria bacterium]|nr:UDP-N-acetylmuramoyl-L-alanine--D-glutamate ligase [Deltaproteobacteria bacterium]